MSDSIYDPLLAASYVINKVMSINFWELVHRRLTYPLAMELFGNPVELTHTNTTEQQLARGGIHIPTTTLAAAQDVEFHAG